MLQKEQEDRSQAQNQSLNHRQELVEELAREREEHLKAQRELEHLEQQRLQLEREQRRMKKERDRWNHLSVWQQVLHSLSSRPVLSIALFLGVVALWLISLLVGLA